METLADILQTGGLVLGWAVTALLCAAGILLCVLTLSGTWLVVAAAALAAVLRPGAFPGIGTVLVFALVSGLAEGFEALAGSWGVMQRGGSKTAGLLAAVGGLAGFLLGGLIPVPLVGNFIGMLVLGFLLVYAWERRRLRQGGAAAAIAWGSVLGRLAVMGVKVAAAVGMSGVLLWGLLRG
ncbi:MAG: DUF456 family protein [Lentisphaerae bacterium]|nr:DUF456 family protein [Lentisphaerota bacterium]